MEAVIFYKSNDGRFHHTIAAAQNADNLIQDIEYTMKSLQIPEYERFSSGIGYHQHDLRTVRFVKKQLILLSKTNSSIIAEKIANGADLTNVHATWFGRMIEDGPLAQAWGKMARITDDGREYGQQYYAMHPDQAQDKRLNP